MPFVGNDKMHKNTCDAAHKTDQTPVIASATLRLTARPHPFNCLHSLNLVIITRYRLARRADHPELGQQLPTLTIYLGLTVHIRVSGVSDCASASKLYGLSAAI